MNISRALLPAALAGALLITGCTAGGAPTQDAAGEDCLAPGAVSKSLKVSGAVGGDLVLDAKTPVSTKNLERSVLVEGKGDLVKEGDATIIAMTMFNGANGEPIQQVPSSTVQVDKASLATWAYEGIRCAVPGQQTAIVAPYAEVFGELAPEKSGVEGITVDDSIVIVMEFGGTDDSVTYEKVDPSGEPGTLGADELLKKAEGVAQPAPKGFPTVKLAEDGAPTITMPKGVDAPEKLQVATLIEGDGETVQPGDRVYVNYRGVIWNTGEEFDSSWSRGTPIDFMTTQVIGGFRDALEGQKVGSQVISVVPANDGGYGSEGLQTMGHQPDDVMVFVLDILGTVHAPDAK